MRLPASLLIDQHGLSPNLSGIHRTRRHMTPELAKAPCGAGEASVNWRVLRACIAIGMTLAVAACGGGYHRGYGYGPGYYGNGYFGGEGVD